MTRKPTRSFISLSAIVAFATLLAPAAWAAPITVPTDLNPGDHYRLAFVTSTKHDATSTDIGVYNAFVTAVANAQPELAALGTTWTAIGSTASIDARDNTGTNPTIATGVPIYGLDDVRIADNNADLWDGALSAPIAKETGNLQSAYPWTGTAPTGIASTFPLGTPAGVTFGTTFITILPPEWIAVGVANPAADSQAYAISGTLTVVPEPGTMLLGCIGAAALAGWMLRRRVHRRRR